MVAQVQAAPAPSNAQYLLLKRCPKAPEGITFAAYWFRIKGIDEFWICSKCYQDHISGTSITSICERFYDDPLPGTRSICDFDNARAKQLVRARRVDGLKRYARQRAAAGMCPGTKAVPGGQGLKWYSNAELPHFVACEACYEDWILASSFGEKFFMRDPQEHVPEALWSCDVNVPFIKRIITKPASWEWFVGAIQHRMALPPCGGRNESVKLSSRRWLQPVKPSKIEGMRVCEACFLDQVAEFPAASSFAEVAIPPAEADGSWFCEFVDLPISICTAELVEKDYPRWHRYVTEILSKQMCTRQNITDGEWYGLLDPHDPASTILNHDVCSACYIGLIKSANCEDVFRRLSFSPGTTRCCDFSPMASKSPKYFDMYRQMLATGDPVPFQRWVSKIAPLPECPGMESVTDRKWWGTDDFCFCEACYEEVGRDTYFAPSFPHQGGVLQSANCDMFSDNMRRRYALACRAKSLDEFVAYSKERAQCWNEYLTSIRIHQEQQAARNRSNLLQMSLAGTLRARQMVSGSSAASSHGHAYSAVADPMFMAANTNFQRAQNQAILGMVTPKTAPEISIEARWLAMR